MVYDTCIFVFKRIIENTTFVPLLIHDSSSLVSYHVYLGRHAGIRTYVWYYTSTLKESDERVMDITYKVAWDIFSVSQLRADKTTTTTKPRNFVF